MNVEIDDRDALRAVHGLRMESGDGCVIEQTETHRLGDFGVMTRRTNAAEGVVGEPLHHLVNGVDRGAGRSQRRLPASRRNHGVAVVERDHLLRGLLLLKEVDIGSRMGARDLVGGRERRLHRNQVLEPRGGQRLLDRVHAFGPLRMPFACVVSNTSLMGDLQGGHGAYPAFLLTSALSETGGLLSSGTKKSGARSSLGSMR